MNPLSPSDSETLPRVSSFPIYLRGSVDQLNLRLEISIGFAMVVFENDSMNSATCCLSSDHLDKALFMLSGTFYSRNEYGYRVLFMMDYLPMFNNVELTGCILVSVILAIYEGGFTRRTFHSSEGDTKDSVNILWES